MRSNAIYYIIFILGLVLLCRLFYIQVIDDYYSMQVQKNVLKVLRIQPPRGNIYDRNDKLIVTNEISYNLMCITNNIKDLDTLDFCKYLGITKKTFIDKIDKAKRKSKYKPYLFYDKISKYRFASFQEKLFNYKGFYIETKFQRYYNFDAAANVLGYIGEIQKKQLKKDKYYVKGDLVGVTGVEKSYENQLRGRSGIKHIKVDVKGRRKGVPFEKKNISWKEN